MIRGEKEMNEKDEEIYQKALELVHKGVPAEAMVVNRLLCVGYDKAVKICNLLVSRGVVDPETRDIKKV
jgi:hypothetical protein